MCMCVCVCVCVYVCACVLNTVRNKSEPNAFVENNDLFVYCNTKRKKFVTHNN